MLEKFQYKLNNNNFTVGEVLRVQNVNDNGNRLFKMCVERKFVFCGSYLRKSSQELVKSIGIRSVFNFIPVSRAFKEVCLMYLY